MLAVATFASVRSARQAARTTERALLAGLRPVLVPSRFEDPVEKVGFQDDHWVKVPGGGAIAEATGDAIYFAIALRNAGTGLAVLDRWDFMPADERIGRLPHGDPETYRRLTRDLYISGGSLGFWQGTIRETSDPGYAQARDAIAGRQLIVVDLLYGDHEGGQRTITRIALRPHDDSWIATVARRWNLDRADPR